MINYFIDLLNGLSTSHPLGTWLGAILFFISLAVAIYKGVIRYNNKIKMQGIKEEEERKFRTDMLELKGTVDKFDEKLQILDKSVKDQNESTCKKIDELTEAINNTQDNSTTGDKVLEKKIEKYESALTDVKKSVSAVNDKTDLLIASDKEGIKSDITTDYYIAIDQGFIELHKMQMLEARYEKYLQENGNTFIKSLMDELRKLPHHPPVDGDTK